jgi:hypothetical protein
MSSNETAGPDIVLVLTELAELGAEALGLLGSIMVQGPRYRIRVLAASARRPTELVQHCSALPEFRTRLVLRAADEEESLALLGSVDAIELGPGGHLLARLEARVPLQAHGYRAAPDRLARLAAAIHKRAAPATWWRPTLAEHARESLVSERTALVDGSGSTTEGLEGNLACVAEEPAITAEDHTDAGATQTDVVEAADRGLENADEACAPEPKVAALGEVADPDDGALDRPEWTNGHHAYQTSEGSSSVEGLRRNGVHVDAATRPRLRGRFLGARELRYDDEVIWPLPGEPDDSAMELLVFLAVQDPSGVRSEMLGDSFWEADDDDTRGDRLKKRRYRLRLAIKKLLPDLDGDVLARLDKQNPIHRLNPSVIESDVHRFLKLVESAKRLEPEGAIRVYEEALELYGGDLLDRPDVPPYRWLDDGPRLIDLRVRYAAMRQQVRRRLADLLSSGSGEQLARAQELYGLLANEDPLDHRLWENLARLHGRRSDLLGLEATYRRLRGALVELGEGEDPERVPVPPALAHVFADVRASLLNRQVA